MERENYNLKNMIMEEEKSMGNRVEDVRNRVHTMESSMHIIVKQIYNILKEANENIKLLINKEEENITSKEEDLASHSAKDRILDDSLRKHTRSSMKKMDILEPD